MTARRWLIAIGAGLAFFLLAGRALADLYVDYLWYDALGASSIWRAKAFTGAALWVLSGSAGIAFVFANLYAVRRTVASVSFPRRVANLEIGEEVPPRYLTIGTLVLAIVLGLILTLPIAKWTSFEFVRMRPRFGETDPYFQYDLSFWVGWLPLETDLFLWSLIAILLVTVIVLFLYAMTRSVRWERGKLVVGSHARRHFAVLGAIMLLLLAWSYRLDGFELLNIGTGPEGAFSYLDHRVAKPVGAILGVIAVAAAMVVLFTAWTGQTGAAKWTVAGVLLLSFLLNQIGPVIARRMAEPRDPERRERPYLATRAGYTRRAYAVDRIAEEPGLGRTIGTSGLVLGLPVWDTPALMLAAGARTADESLAVGWRLAPSGVSALIARAETNEARTTWTLSRFDGQHGDDRGAPVRIDEAVDVALAARPPLVYPGAVGYLVQSDTVGNVAAASLDRPFSRLAHAWSLQNFRLLFGDLPDPQPRIAIRRGIRERLTALVPFFALGTDITPVIDGDSLVWIAHLYSASTSYPLSRRLQIGGRERAYFHHAAVALVDAATGRVTIVPDSTPDPVARAWFRRFPRVFDTARRLSPTVARVLPPPADAAAASAMAFALTGSRSEAVSRHVPWADGADSVFTTHRPTPVFLPNERGEITEALVHLLLDDLERIDGAVITFGGPGYRTIWVPSQSETARWPLLRERLVRAGDTTAWTSGTVRGPVRAMPSGAGLVLAQTSYAYRPGVMPIVRHIALLNGDRLATGATTAAALGISEMRADTTAAPRTPADFQQRVARLYEAMRSAMQRGDWAAFGRAYEELGRIVRRPPP